MPSLRGPPLACALGALLMVVPSRAAEPEPQPAGEEPPPAPPRERPPPIVIDLDLTLLDAGLSAAGHLGKSFYLGGGFSFFPALSISTFSAYPIEIADLHAFARYDVARLLDVDLGARAAYFQEFHLCIFGPCGPPPSGWLLGPYVDVRFGFPHVKLGPRAAYAIRSDTERGGFLLYPLFLRIEVTP